MTPEPTRAPRDSPQHCGRLAAGQLAELLDRCHNADVGVLAVEPRHDEDLVLTPGVGCVHCRLPLGIVEGDRHDHARQHYHIGERENRELLSL